MEENEQSMDSDPKKQSSNISTPTKHGNRTNMEVIEVFEEIHESNPGLSTAILWKFNIVRENS